jgi:hypothetical protein
MYSSQDDHDISGQPRLVVLKWDFPFLLMIIITFHIFGIQVEVLFFRTIIWLRDVVSWRFRYQIKRFLDFIDRKSIKSSTECTKTSSGVLTTGLLCCFLRGRMGVKDNASICPGVGSSDSPKLIHFLVRKGVRYFRVKRFFLGLG